MRYVRIAAATIVLAGPAGLSAEEAASTTRLDLESRWHSRYVSEGRDNLGGDDLLSVAGGLSLGEWRAGGWFGAALDQDYQELSLFVERGVDVGPVRLYGRYARLDFPAQERDDNELSAGATASAADAVQATVDYTYSNEADGGFVRVSLGASAMLFDGALELSTDLLQGFDYGYASEAHDGANHRQAGIDAQLRLSRRWRLVGSLNRSWALADVERSGGGDLTWGTVGLATRL